MVRFLIWVFCELFAMFHIVLEALSNCLEQVESGNVGNTVDCVVCDQ
jgi:hypothetical protein